MMETILTIAGIIVPAILTYVIALKNHKRELKKMKQDYEIEMAKLQDSNNLLTQQQIESDLKLIYYNQIINFTSFNTIRNSVKKMFEKTKATRFLILIAMNGKTDFRVVNAVFQQHKEDDYEIDAISTYKNIEIDVPYQQMLKLTKVKPVVELETVKMKDQILKDYYQDEGINHALVRQLLRQRIDDDNVFLIYSSIGTHYDKKFTRAEKTFIKTHYENTIKPKLSEIFKS